MKQKFSQCVKFICALTLMLVASAGTAQAQFTPADPADIRDAYRVDGPDGVLETAFTMIGAVTNYMWLAGLIFIVGWAAFRRMRRVMG